MNNSTTLSILKQSNIKVTDASDKVKTFKDVMEGYKRATNYDGDLLSDCCQADFDPFGFERGDGLWQESCLKCGKGCEPIWTKPVRKNSNAAILKPVIEAYGRKDE